MKKLLFLLLPSVLVMSSCASVFHGSSGKVAINSTTQGAKIYVDGSFAGSDSVNVKLKRNKNHAVIIKKDGFKSESINITKEFQVSWLFCPGMFLLPCFNEGVGKGGGGGGWIIAGICFIIDAATGAWYGLSHDNISVDLIPEREQKK